MTETPTTPKSKVIKSLALIAASLAIGLGVAWWLYVIRIEPPRHETSNAPPVVETIILSEETVTERFIGYGTVRPFRKASLTAEVTARIVERAAGVRVGDAVEEGQVLFRLDDRDFRLIEAQAQAVVAADQASLDELNVEEVKLQTLIHTAEAELRLRKDEKNRVTGLFERELAAKKEYDFANLSYHQARRTLQSYEREAARIVPRRAQLGAAKRQHEAAAARAALNVDRCEVVAPFDGVIDAIRTEVGEQAGPFFEFLGPANQMVTIVDSARVEVDIQLPASVYNRTQAGSEVRLSTESAPGAMWIGEVARVAPTVDPQSRTFDVYIVVDNTQQERPLVPGTFVRAEVAGPTYDDRLLVPRGAITDGRIFTIDNGIVRARTVRTERTIADRAIVTGDIHPGDRIALTRLDSLTDGRAVRAVDARSAGGVSPDGPVMVPIPSDRPATP